MRILLLFVVTYAAIYGVVTSIKYITKNTVKSMGMHVVIGVVAVAIATAIYFLEMQ